MTNMNEHGWAERDGEDTYGTCGESFECIADLKRKAARIRSELVQLIHRAGGGHIGGALSTVDLLVALFYGVMHLDPQTPRLPDRDRFILSKGHSCEAYYAILADLGFITREELTTYQCYGSRLMGHPHPKIPGVEAATGSLGHGLGLSAGMALAARMDGLPYRVFCLLGDGELGEGSVWEAAMFAAHYKLDNLVCIIDRNGLQISGRTEEILGLEPLAARWEAFGWYVREIDGHEMEEIVDALRAAPFASGTPSLIIARTVKGKGVSFMEGDRYWHHRVPDADQTARALAELGSDYA